MKIMVKMDDLSKYYGKGGEINAVIKFNLEVYEGEPSMSTRKRLR